MFQLIFFLLFLSACSTAPKKIKKQSASNAVQLQEQVAQFTSLPDTPFGFKLIKMVHDQTDQSSVCIQYQSCKCAVVDIQELQKLYLADMELLGWNCVSQFQTSDEMLLLFERPSKVWCQVLCKGDTLQVMLLKNQKK